jgi:DNA-binding response OmpR family regulator
MADKTKVLLVDDDAGFLKATAMVLEHVGYEVITAQDGRAGLAAAKEHRPDAIVVDVIMGRPDEGFVLARAIRGEIDLADAKVFILTAVAQQYDMLFEPDDLWLPVDKVLEKPITGTELANEIAALLARDEDDEDRT